MAIRVVKPKRGDIREDGKVFLRFHPNAPNGEIWSTMDQLKKERKKDKDRSAKRYAEDPKRYNSSRIKWGIENPEKKKRVNKNSKLKCLYGIFIEKYEEMLELQNGVCAICGEVCKIRESLSVDHCHKTNIVRGLLCHSCNTTLGQMKESPEVLRKAAEYLEKHQSINY
jgi:hypothetical protein